ncbi:MAG: hypothetical protein M1831_002131 [Alyxoria varia]|nr:MAG: hypothetical protein M1831_002131 [Alyxoria varia]
MPSLRPTHASCKYQSTQTSRRRIPYTIGSDLLEPEVPEPPSSLSPDHLKTLNHDLEKLYHSLLPSEESQERRKLVVEKLQRILREEWPQKGIKVFVFGSSGNLLCTNESDEGMKNVTCVHAKAVPIVKTWDPELEMACDLNVNNHVALKNTEMVKAYMAVSWKIRAFAMIIKHWTSSRIINQASGGTLSSYTWTCMIIHFLQTQEPPALPILALKNDDGRPKENFDDQVEQFHTWFAKNDASLGELLFRFFRYYGYEFDYEKSAISVAKGHVLTKQEKSWHIATNNRLCVEEPFNTDRNLGNTADDTAFRGLHQEIRRAFKCLCESSGQVQRLCEQYQFPDEGQRITIPERPAKYQPRPTKIEPPPNVDISKSSDMSRTSSVSGRGNRNGSSRSSRFRGERAGANARRSASATAYGSHSYGAFQHPIYGVPVTDPTFLALGAVPSQQELGRQRRELHLQELDLRAREYLNQAEIDRRTMLQYPEFQQNGYPATTQFTPHPNQSYAASGAAPYSVTPSSQGFPASSQFTSSHQMTPSSSYQGTQTNQSSPMLQAATPPRRNLQPNVDISPRSASRSQSQPARTQPVPPTAPRALQAHLPALLQQQPLTMAKPLLAYPVKLYEGGPTLCTWMGTWYRLREREEIVSRQNLTGKSRSLDWPSDWLSKRYLGFGIGERIEDEAKSQDDLHKYPPLYDNSMLHDSRAPDAREQNPLVQLIYSPGHPLHAGDPFWFSEPPSDIELELLPSSPGRRLQFRVRKYNFPDPVNPSVYISDDKVFPVIRKDLIRPDENVGPTTPSAPSQPLIVNGSSSGSRHQVQPTHEVARATDDQASANGHIKGENAPFSGGKLVPTYLYPGQQFPFLMFAPDDDAGPTANHGSRLQTNRSLYDSLASFNLADGRDVRQSPSQNQAGSSDARTRRLSSPTRWSSRDDSAYNRSHPHQDPARSFGIPPLDLDTAGELQSENNVPSHLLSPVREAQTPSPSNSRKPELPRSNRVNGDRRSTGGLHELAPPHAYATVVSSSMGKENRAGSKLKSPTVAQTPVSMNHLPSQVENGNASSTQRRRSAAPGATSPQDSDHQLQFGSHQSPISPTTRAPLGNAASTSTNSWQQAGKKGGRKTRGHNSYDAGDRKPRGEPLPANEADWKGG